jgi:hypothetical protein
MSVLPALLYRHCPCLPRNSPTDNMNHKSPKRSRVVRLLVPFVVLGLVAGTEYENHVPSLVAAIVLVVLLWVMIGVLGYGPRRPR